MLIIVLTTILKYIEPLFTDQAFAIASGIAFAKAVAALILFGLVVRVLALV